MEKFKFLPRNKIAQLAQTPGVYAFFDGKKVLYIGKAVNLRERVKQHREPFGSVGKVGYIKTDSDIEALLLEAKLIKKYQPKYNVAWRDDKNYFFVGITKENFPQVFITHQPKPISNFQFSIFNFVGPFVDGKAIKETLKILRKVFPYRSCANLAAGPCLWYQLKRCPAPCLVREQVPGFKEKVKKECQKNIKNLMMVLQEGKSPVLKKLKEEMRTLSKEEKFEEAAKLRNQIQSLEKVMSHALVEIGDQQSWPYRRIEAYDVSNIQGKEATGAMVTFIEGQPDKNFYRRFKIKTVGQPNDVAMIKEILERRLKHSEWPYPDLILIDGGKAQLNAAIKITNLPVMALAKKNNELYAKGKKQAVLLKTMPREIFNLILQLRDEAHRFARAYHHKLRKKYLLE